MEYFQVSRLREDHKSYAEFLRTGNLSAGVYRLTAGATDEQRPHAEEEVYYVISGRARFRAGERDLAVSAGDILFVEPGETHHFHEIQQDLEVLVLFAPAEGSRK